MFPVVGGLEHHFVETTSDSICRTYIITVDRCFSEASLGQESRQIARGYGSCEDERMTRNAMEQVA